MVYEQTRTKMSRLFSVTSNLTCDQAFFFRAKVGEKHKEEKKIGRNTFSLPSADFLPEKEHLIRSRLRQILSIHLLSKRMHTGRFFRGGSEGVACVASVSVCFYACWCW